MSSRKEYNQMLKAFLTSMVLTAFTVLPIKSFAHGGGEEARVDFEVESSNTASAGTVEFIFELVDNQQKKALTDADLLIEMEKKMHFIAYDKALLEFQHVHPEYKADGKWHVNLNFTKSGQYVLWATGKIAADSKDFSASTDLTITGGDPANSLPAHLVESRAGGSGNSLLMLASTKIYAGKMAMLNATFSRNDGSTPSITPYLGALAHVTIVTDDADSMIHAHPMATGQPNKIMLHTMFPEAGLYRVWFEFIDGGILKRVPLVVNVLK
jgi:hypothetical protein